MNMGKEGPVFNKSESREKVFGKELDDRSLAEYRFDENFELNGKKVEIKGVMHVPETFELYRKEFEEAIEKASIVILEAAPVADRTFSNQTVEFIKSLANKSGAEVSREQIINDLESNRSLIFFRNLENLIARKGKRLATIDPINYEPMFSNDNLRMIDFLIRLVKAAIVSGGILFLSEKLLDKAKGEGGQQKSAEGELTLKPKEKGMSRRAFLKTAVGGLSAAGLGSLFAELFEFSGGKPGQEELSRGRKENPLGVMLYELLDYRDVSLAKGLDVLTKRDLGNGPVVVFYGGLHASAVRHYAENHKERDIKFETYRPYRSVAPPKLRIYEFDKKEGWKLIKDSDI
jgi:hypothetical protein